MFFYVDKEEAKYGNSLILATNNEKIVDYKNVLGGNAIEFVGENLPFYITYDEKTNSIREATELEKLSRGQLVLEENQVIINNQIITYDLNFQKVVDGKVVNKTKNLKSKAKKRTNSKNTRVTKKVQNIATKSKNIKQKILPVVVGAFLAILGGVVIVEYYDNTKIIIQRQLVGSTNVERAWNFYQEEGFSEEATAGMLGNFMRESKMNPAAEEIGNKIGYGIAQWSFTRRTDLEKWTKEKRV